MSRGRPMQKFLKNEKVLKDCKIYRMLSAHATERHLSFHTPGHKVGAWDITELGFSDNLSAPKGCIAEAERDIAEILGAKKSFILTDGSTAGVLSMLYAAKALGAKTVAVCEASHKSVFNGCKLLGLTPLVFAPLNGSKMQNEPTVYALNKAYGGIFSRADALFFTSPDYYGNISDLAGAREYCDKNGKLLLVDGAHGGHLHFDKNKYAGAYADLWVDGVHKSLPAFTQGAVVSARTEVLAERLREGVDIFRTTSPSYPIMASGEYAVKYPRNTELERKVRAFQEHPRIYKNGDWTKLCAPFGEYAFEVEKLLETEGIYPEFCDGSIVMFYLSPATTSEEFEALKSRLETLFETYPYAFENEARQIPAPYLLSDNAVTEWVKTDESVGRICANNCGLFPPCTPLLLVGERVTREKVGLLEKSNNVFGVIEGKILVVKETTKE